MSSILSFRSFCCVLTVLGCSLTLDCGPAYADSPKQIVTNSSQALSNHTDQLAQLVQVFLQNAGRWSPMPQGADMQLCQALQEFQKRAKTLRGDAKGSFSRVQSDLQNLQFQSQVLEQLLNKQVSSPIVGTAWLQVRNDMQSMGQAMTLPIGAIDPDAYYEGRNVSNTGIVPNGFNQNRMNGMPINPFANNVSGVPLNPFANNVAGMPVNPYANNVAGMPSPFGYNPTNVNITENSTFDSRPSFQGNFNNFGAYPNGINGGYPNNYGNMQNFGSNNSNLSSLSSSLSSADDQSERFVKQLSKFFQKQGQWPPAAGTPAMVLCQNVQTFQQQLRRLKSDAGNNQSPAALQAQMQQLGAASQSIDQQLMQTGVSADVTARWNEVRTSLNSAYQTVYSAQSGFNWNR